MSDPNLDAADTYCTIQEMQHDAFTKGYYAWEDGKTYGSCPYPNGNPARMDWQQGWRDAENAFRMDGDCALRKPEPTAKEADRK